MTAAEELRAPRLTPASAEPDLISMPSWQREYARFLAVTDTVSVVVAVGLAQWLRFGGIPAKHGTYSVVSLCIAVSWILALSINHSRSPRIIGAGAEEYRRVWIGTMSVFGGVAILSMLLKLEIARGYLMIALPTGLGLLFVFRWLARQRVAKQRERYGHCITRILAVGSVPAVTELVMSLSREPSCGYKVVGVCVPGSTSVSHIDVQGIGPIPAFSGKHSVTKALAITRSNAVAVTAADRFHGEEIRDLSWELEKFDIDLLVAPGVVDVAGPRLHMRPVAGLPLIHVERPQYHGAQRFQKRLFDIGFSSLVLICASPLLLAIAIAIKLSSKGPVFYRQERIGLDGQPFEMIKFRTMVDGADRLVEELAHLNESDGGVLFKIRQDPRITPVGRFLRRYSLDEIPQFINVLRRDMSVVGPRPPLPREVETYSDCVKRRLLVRPGITGLWQVSGRSDLSWDDSVRLDLFYVENWSMMADLLIALKTAKAMLRHDGAY